ncbi:MAG: hypothetical protein J7M29_01980, partial [Verrucomicrobia bacterium]|nr:hypothetical protein [Verrucomicrobiota bacterium]
MKTIRRTATLIGLCVGLAGSVSLQAGHAEYNFDSDPSAFLDIDSNLDPAPWRATGGNPGGYLAITDAVGSQRTVIRFDDFDSGMLVKGFTFSMDVRMGSGTTDRPADGFSVNYARSNDPIFTDPGMWTGAVHGIDLGPEGGTSTGLSVCFDAWQGNPLPDGNDIEGIIVRVDDVTVLRQAMPTRHGSCDDITSMQTGPQHMDADGNPDGDPSTLCWQPLTVDLSAEGKLTVTYKGHTFLDQADVEYFPSPGRLVLMGRTGGSNQNQHVDNIVIDTIPASTPTVVGAKLLADGVTVQIQDAPGVQVVDGSVSLKVNGEDVTASSNITKSGDITTIEYSTLPDLLPGGTKIDLEIGYQDTQGESYTIERSLTVEQYTLVPADLKAADVNTSTTGFRIRPYQVEEANPNDNDWTEEMLQGLHGENKADTFGLDAEGFMDWLDVIDFKNDSGGSGNFTLDYPLDMVNIPGPDMTSEDNCALEIIGYIEFPQAGMYTMGVNSDDGFRVQTYTNPRDAFALRPGEYNGSRGASDTTFKIYIREAGIYPFRLVWENGGGGAAVEWFMVQDDGTKVLLNDAMTPGSLNVYPRAASTPPYVKLVSPAIDATGVRADTPIEEVIAEGDTGQVDQGSVA